MSWEEDYLMRRVGELTAALKGAGLLHECESCTTLYAIDLEKCPNCGHEKGAEVPDMMAGPRPTPLGVESTGAANALPPSVVHGTDSPTDAEQRAEGEHIENTGEDNLQTAPVGGGAVVAGPQATEQPGDTNADRGDQTGDADGNGEPQETVGGKPRAYAELNVEQLKRELDDRKLFYPSNARRDALVTQLKDDDRQRAEQANS